MGISPFQFNAYLRLNLRPFGRQDNPFNFRHRHTKFEIRGAAKVAKATTTTTTTLGLTHTHKRTTHAHKGRLDTLEKLLPWVGRFLLSFFRLDSQKIFQRRHGKDLRFKCFIWVFSYYRLSL